MTHQAAGVYTWRALRGGGQPVNPWRYVECGMARLGRQRGACQSGYSRRPSTLLLLLLPVQPSPLTTAEVGRFPLIFVALFPGYWAGDETILDATSPNSLLWYPYSVAAPAAVGQTNSYSQDDE